jgi:hypothetical protein
LADSVTLTDALVELPAQSIAVTVIVLMPACNVMPVTDHAAVS